MPLILDITSWLHQGSLNLNSQTKRSPHGRGTEWSSHPLRVPLTTQRGGKEREKGKEWPGEHRLFLSGTVSLIHNVTFKEERESGPAWFSLVSVWLQVRAGPRPIVTLDQMASINTYNQSRVSAQSCSQMQSGSPAQPYSNHRPSVTFPPNVAVILAWSEIYWATNTTRAASESICMFSLPVIQRLLVFLIKLEVSLNRADHPWRSDCLRHPQTVPPPPTDFWIHRQTFAKHLVCN